jgi:single-strand DNA-binding protein
MFDTYVTVVGNVLHSPEQRQTSNTGAVVTTFKIASTARRMDRQTGKWIDGNSLRVRVTCWRSLAHNVAQSVKVGDPLVVHGRLFTRDWEDEQGNKRLAYELEAMAVGHDLSRGRAFFERVRPRTTTSAIEDADAEARVGGELTEPVPDSEAVQFDDTPFEAVFDQPAAVPEGLAETQSQVGDDSGPADFEPDPAPEPAEEVGGRRRRSKVSA